MNDLLDAPYDDDEDDEGDDDKDDDDDEEDGEWDRKSSNDSLLINPFVSKHRTSRSVSISHE